MNEKKGVKNKPGFWRYIAFFITTGLMAIALLVFYAQVMLFPPVGIAGPRLTLPQVERGPIFDHNGRLLAVTTSLETATIWLPQVIDKAETASKLSEILSISMPDLLKRFQTGPNYQYIKRQLTQKEATAIRELKANNELQGVRLEKEWGRSYPERDLGAGVIGYVGTDNIGLAGIEYTFNDVLAPVEVGSDDSVQIGASVYLTLDSVLQHSGEQIANKTRLEQKALRVNILVQDAQTGHILVWATSPSFDPNRFREYSDEERSNPILTRAYEPGSVFKPFALATLLDADLIQVNDTFPCFGFYEQKMARTGEVIRIKDLASYGMLDLTGIIVHSSNAGMGYASDRITSKQFEEQLRLYGFGSPTGISLVGETSGILKSSQLWSARTKPTIAMGQEIGVSALQILQAASAFANHGVMIKPQIVHKVVSATGEVLVVNEHQEVRSIMKDSTVNKILPMMQAAIEEGTGQRAQIEGLPIAGKTGTAQMRDPKTGRYSDTQFIASVLLLLPASKPRYIIYVTIENPSGGTIYGGRIAAPVGKLIGEKLIQILGLPLTTDSLIVHPGIVKLTSPPTLLLGNIMPDLRGLAKRSLLPILNRTDILIDIQGEGWVVRQTPEPGTPITKNMLIKLELE